MIRVATFNLESLDDHPKGGIAFEDRLAALRPQLRRLRADILCLQEVNAHAETKHGPRLAKGLDLLLEGTPYQDYARSVSGHHGLERPADLHNLVLLSRRPPQAVEQVWHDLAAPCRWTPAHGEALEARWDRPVQRARFAMAEGLWLNVINLHLKAPRAAWMPGGKDESGRWRSVGAWAEGFFLAAVKQAGQALEARLLVERIMDSEPDALIAVCGDFNAGDHEAALRLIRGDEEDVGNGHLAARMLTPVERSLSESLRFSVIHHGRRVLLDHVLASRSLLGRFRAAEIHNEALGDELVSPASISGPPDSYHAPLVAEFDLDWP